MMSIPSKRFRISLITFVVPSAVETSAWIKWLSVFSAGAERAVMMTIAPPCWKRAAIALPAPFVPPVTKARLPANSFASREMLDVLMVLTLGLFRGEVVEQDFLRKGKKNFLRGLLMNRVLCIMVHRCFVFEPHDKADVERSVSPRTRFRQCLADGEELHFGNLACERVRRRDNLLPMHDVTRLF